MGTVSTFVQALSVGWLPGSSSLVFWSKWSMIEWLQIAQSLTGRRGPQVDHRDACAFVPSHDGGGSPRAGRGGAQWADRVLRQSRRRHREGRQLVHHRAAHDAAATCCAVRRIQDRCPRSLSAVRPPSPTVPSAPTIRSKLSVSAIPSLDTTSRPLRMSTSVT